MNQVHKSHQSISLMITCQLCWICLNQCQSALQLYWISEAISLAESVWISDSQHLDCTELLSLSVWLNLSELVSNSTKTVLNFRVYQSGWIFLNQCQLALRLYWIPEAISLAESVWIVDSQHLDCTDFLSLSVWLNLSESVPNSTKIILNFRVYQSNWIFLN